MDKPHPQAGELVFLKGPSQWRNQSGVDTSAGICTAVHSVGAEIHCEVQRLNQIGNESPYDIIDAQVLGSADQILKTHGVDSVILKDQRSQSHLKIFVTAITTAGWCLTKEGPVLGQPHWIPGSFERGSIPVNYYYGEDGRDDQFKVAVQGYVLCDQTIEVLTSNGCDITGQSYYSTVLIEDFISDSSTGQSIS